MPYTPTPHEPPAPSIESAVLSFWPKVYGCCLRRLRHPTDAEDATQEVFRKYLESAETITGHPEGWLVRCARNTCVDHIRRNRRRHKREARRAVDEARRDATVTRLETRELVQHFLARLAPDERDLLHQHLVERVPQGTLAQELGVSQQLVSRRVQAAKTKLHGWLVEHVGTLSVGGAISILGTGTARAGVGLAAWLQRLTVGPALSLMNPKLAPTAGTLALALVIPSSDTAPLVSNEKPIATAIALPHVDPFVWPAVEEYSWTPTPGSITTDGSSGFAAADSGPSDRRASRPQQPAASTPPRGPEAVVAASPRPRRDATSLIGHASPVLPDEATVRVSSDTDETLTAQASTPSPLRHRQEALAAGFDRPREVLRAALQSQFRERFLAWRNGSALPGTFDLTPPMVIGPTVFAAIASSLEASEIEFSPIAQVFAATEASSIAGPSPMAFKTLASSISPGLPMVFTASDSLPSAFAEGGSIADFSSPASILNLDRLELSDELVVADLKSPRGSELVLAGVNVFTGNVSGAGHWRGDGTAVLAGTHSPGDSPAFVDVGGSLVYTPGSLLHLELAGTEDGEYDRLTVAGDVSLAAELMVSLIDGFTLAADQTFLVFDIAGLAEGRFVNYAEGDLVAINAGGAGLSPELFITYRAGDGNDIALFTRGLDKIQGGVVTVVPEPATAAWLLLTATLVRRRRRA